MGTFACHGCGGCCTNLKDAWAHAPTRKPSIPDDRIHRLEAPAGLRLFTWEASRFPADRLEPLLVTADANTQRLITLAYVLDADTCPNHDDEDGCTIYPDRPLVCQAYPLLLTSGRDGNHLAVSKRCPAHIPPDEAEPANAYPHEVAPALTVPAALDMLTSALDLLENAGIITPRKNPTPRDLEGFRKEDPIDLAELGREHGIFSERKLRTRTGAIQERLRERTTPNTDETP